MSVITAKPDTATTDSDEGLWINLANNDIDSVSDYSPRVSSLNLDNTLGNVILNGSAPNGAWYDPDGAFDWLAVGQTATDTFSYTVLDGHGGNSTASVTVTIEGVNRSPVAQAAFATTDAQHGVWLGLQNDVNDVNNGDALAIVSLDDTNTRGGVILNPNAHNGAWYDPGTAFGYLSAGETATDRFSYTVSDGHGGTSTATATVIVSGVNAPPVAGPLSATTTVGGTLSMNLLTSVTDPNRDDVLSIASLNTVGTKGTVNRTPGSSTLTYTPGSAFNGLAAGQSATDTFTYTVSDGHGGVSTNTATVTVSGAVLPTTKAFYVATNGSDRWSGHLAQPNLSRTDGPLATLGAAARAMERDWTTQTTYIEGGTYSNNAQVNLLARDSGQTWAAYNGQKAVIDATNDSRAFALYGANNVTISGLTFMGGAASDYAIQISASSNVMVNNTTITGGTNGIGIGGNSDKVSLLNNTLSNLDGAGIMITGRSDHAVVDNNYIHDVGMADAGSGIWFSGSSYDTFSNNTIQNVGKFGIGGGSVDGPSDASVYNTITQNTIDHANMVTPDAGGINILNYAQSPSYDTISFNTVTNTSLGNPNKWIGAGIYLDDFTNKVTVYANKLQNNADGIWVHLGVDNVIDSNVVTGSMIALGMSGESNIATPPLHAPTGNVFKNNTVYLDNAGQLAVRLGDTAARHAYTGTKWLDNIYGGPAIGAKPFNEDISHITTNYSFAQWLTHGFDTTSPHPSAQLTLAKALGNLPTS